MCAEAVLPTPRVVKAGWGLTFRMLPVYRNVLGAESATASKLARDSLIAAYKLMVLMVKSWENSTKEGERGSEGLAKWTAAAVMGVRRTGICLST
jgi:hypothetical protein